MEEAGVRISIHGGRERSYVENSGLGIPPGKLAFVNVVKVRVLGIGAISTLCNTMYRQTANIRRTKCRKLNVSRLVLQLALPNQLKPGAKSRMKT